MKLQSFERRPNPVYYRYELGRKRSICLVSERRLPSGSVPERDCATVEAIRSIENLLKERDLLLHPLWIHLVIFYYVAGGRDLPLKRCSQRLFAIEAQLLDGSLIGMVTIEGFEKHIQGLHEILRTLITLQHSYHRDISFINKMIGDLGRLSEDPVLLDKARTFESKTETRMRDAFLYLRYSCEENCRKLSNRKQRSQNLVELVSNLHLISNILPAKK